MAVPKYVFQTVALVLFASIFLQVSFGMTVPSFDIDGCATKLCPLNETCRVVLPCANCAPEIACVHNNELIGIDSECQQHSYLRALLVKAPTTPSSYTQGKCGGGCLIGFDCVGDNTNMEEGTCCRGRFVVRPGVCPQGQIFGCGGTPCEVDNNCPGDQKCCPGCGMTCSNPVLPVCAPTCASGEECVFQSVLCSSGTACPPTTVCQPVEPVDQCGGCPDGEDCVAMASICATPPCSQFVCQPREP